LWSDERASTFYEIVNNANSNLEPRHKLAPSAVIQRCPLFRDEDIISTQKTVAFPDRERDRAI